MNDILPPQKRSQTPQARPPQPSNRPSMTPSTTPPGPVPLPPVQNTPEPQIPSQGLKTPKKGKKKLVLGVIGVFIGILALIAVACVIWYNTLLSPVNSSDASRIRVTIASGSSPADIADTLYVKKLIKNTFAFEIYTRISGTRSSLQAGTYSLSPSESTQQIVDHMVSGRTDEFKITFLPGATLAENRQTLLDAGYSADAVDAALSKTYTSPLFTDKPASSDLEGYIYGETYNFSSSASVEDILQKTFDEYYDKIKENNLVEGFKAHGLTLYQGITLASIIQREVPTEKDQKQVAQVFYSRLSSGMALGSDVTYQYIAKKLGIAPSPNIDSPYNTRKYAGLPPGPIATPGLSALEAVASPAAGDYLFFLSGDDNVTYFARTNEEHEANVQAHCKIKCALP